MPHRGSPKYATHILGVRVTVADETRVRTEKTGRIGHEAVTEATYVFDRSRAQSPTDTAFLFCKAFFFVAGKPPRAIFAAC